MIRTSLFVLALAVAACGSKPAAQTPAPALTADTPASATPTCCCESMESGLETYAMMTSADCSAAKGTCGDTTACSATDE